MGIKKFGKKVIFDKINAKMMPEYTILNSEEIFEYEAAIVPEGEYIEYEYIPVDCNQLVANDQEIILEPVKTTGDFKHDRISRKRSYKPVDELVRPGKKAKVPDSDLTDKQLISRNKRRARNREAAQRQRDRRLQKRALFEEKIEKLESENKNWEGKYRILEEKYQKLEFQLRMEQRKTMATNQMTTNQNTQNIGNGYKPAKLVKINQKRSQRKNLKVTIPDPIQSTTVFAPAQAPTYAPVSTPQSAKAEESPCYLNDLIKVDTPTAEYVEKMALSRQDSFFTLFDL